MHCEFSESQWYLLHRQQTELLRVLRQGTGASGSQTQSEAGKRFGDPSAVVSLPSCTLPQWCHSSGCPLYKLCLFPGRAIQQAGRFSLWKARATQQPCQDTCWCWTGDRHLPDIPVLCLEGSQWPGLSILGVPGSRVLLQTCPNRLLMGCLRLALGNPTGKSVHGRVHASRLLGCTPETASSSSVGTANAGNYNRSGSSSFWNEKKTRSKSQIWRLTSHFRL